MDFRPQGMEPRLICLCRSIAQNLGEASGRSEIRYSALLCVISYVDPIIAVS